MDTITVRGHTIRPFVSRGSPTRSAQQFKNVILKSLEKIGLDEDDIEISNEAVPIKRAPAKVSFYIDEDYLYISHKTGTYLQNLYVISKIIEAEVNAFLEDRITLEEFIDKFIEPEDVEERQKEARNILSVSEDSTDFKQIHENYKKLAKQHHPDAGGSVDEFKKVNQAHKTLKRELS